MKKVNILWTGGLDSTYRVCQLSLMHVEIQPYYIYMQDRKSYKYELNAIELIKEEIISRKTTNCKLLPLIVVNAKDIENDDQVTNSYNVLHSKFKLGKQYDFLARFAKQKNIYLELGLQFDYHSKAHNCINNFGSLSKVSVNLLEDEKYEYYKIDTDNSNHDLQNVFGNFWFGIPLYDMSKLQIVREYEKIGYDNVIKLTWFCAHPLFGKPCGLCNPCEAVVEAGMDFRLPYHSKVLYKLFKSNNIGRNIDSKLKAFYNRTLRKKF